jgi:hypothetical protein
VAGAHYFRRENNPSFFSGKNFEPTLVDTSEACIYHYELRGSPTSLVKKWRNLSRQGVCLDSLPNQGWVERVELFRRYLRSHESDLKFIERQWFYKDRTVWGNSVPENAVLSNTTIADWNRTFHIKRGPLA